MLTKSNSVLQKRIMGSVFMVLALPMLAFPLLNDGNPFIAIAGAMFLLFGMAAFRRPKD